MNERERERESVCVCVCSSYDQRGGQPCFGLPRISAGIFDPLLLSLSLLPIQT
jgi:hypothetical protein